MGRTAGTAAVRSLLDAVYDVVIVGGGPAGLSAALALGRARRRVLVVDAGEPRNAPATHVHNYLTSEGMPPADLLATGRAEVAQYGVQVVSARVTAAHRLAADGTSDTRFSIDLADGRAIQGRRLLVATGLTDELPDVPGVAELWGRDVLYCPYCHGWEVRDQAIGILGTGPLAVHGALHWRQWSSDVILFRHTAPALTDEQAEQLAARGIAVVDGEVAGLDIEDDRLTGVRLRSGDVIPRRNLVVTPRFAARAGVLRSLGLATIDLEIAGSVIGSRVPAEPTGATTVPGVWVAGNVTDPVGQVITGAADGLRAGAAINADLIAEDTAGAVSRFRAQRAATPDPLSARSA